MADKRKDSIPGYIYALDGLRAVSLILVFMFHNWQQSWIYYKIALPNGKNLLNLTIFQQCGYIAIDAFFVLSGFCLFYPIARAIFGEAKQTSWKEFYKKRIRRILPGYYVMLILLLIFPALSYVTYDTSSASDLFKHFGLHAIFCHIYNSQTAGSVISTAWTLAIEVAFYVMFPAVATAFKKKPALTFILMTIIGQGTRFYCAFKLGTDVAITNFPLGYIDIFGWGMLCAYLVVYARNRLDMKRLKWFMTALSIACIFGVYYFMVWMGSNTVNGIDGPTYFRWFFRYIVSALFAVFIFASAFSIDLWSRRILGNKFFVYLSTISYSFYLWHQNIHIWLKKINVPYTTQNPVTSDRNAMDGFVFLSIVLSLLISTASTYLIEMPISKYGLIGYFKNIGKGIKNAPARIKDAVKNA